MAPAPNKAGGAVAKARRDLWLRALAAAAIAVLAIGLAQEPVAVFGGRSAKQGLLSPIEFNPAARLPLLPAADLHALWFFSPTEGLAAGESGTLLRTADGGAIWQPVQVPLETDFSASGFYALTFESGKQQVGFVGGRDGVLLQTKDQGATWVTVVSPPDKSPPPGQQAQQAQAPFRVIPSGSQWLYEDTAALAVRSGGDWLSVASEKGTGLRTWSGEGPSTWTTLESNRFHRVASDGTVVVSAGPTGLSMHPWTGRTARAPTTESPDGVYTALAVRNSVVFAAGDRFRIKRIVLPPETQRKAAFGGGLSASDFSPDSSSDFSRDGSWVAAEALRQGEDAKPVIHGCSITADGAGWAVGDGGAIWLVKPGRAVAGGAEALGVRRRDVPEFGGTLFAVWAFSADEAVVAGKDGAIFRTRDGGASWAPLTRNCWPADQRGSFQLKLPAPWCWLALALLSGLGWGRWQRLPATIEERDAVAEELTSDRPLEPGEADRLGFAALVQGLSRYLRNTSTQAPLTLAVTGAWGAGKSSFMNLLRSDLDEKGLRTVWFNAWHHQQEPQILAPLLSAIQAEAAPPLLSDKIALALRFRWRLLQRRIWPPGQLMLWAVAFLGLLLGIGAALQWKMPFEVLSGAVEKLGSDKPWEGLSGLGFGSSALGATFLLAWQAMKTFGVSPAALLATEVGKTSEQALSAQTSFRREFAEQFGEVAEALKPFPLVIFIDDLDRCEVPKVFQILEAINYLVSNGACFVVLGMSEERVRDAVALWFKDLPADFGEPEAPPEAKAGDRPGDATPARPKDAWVRQRELAQNYLEKLVQLRVDVPRPDLEAARRMVRAEAAKAKAEASGWRAITRAWWRDHLLTVVAIVGLLVLLAGTFRVGGWIAPLLEPAVKPAVTPPAKVEIQGSVAGQPAQTPPAGGAGGAPPAAAEHLYEERGLAPATPEPGHDGPLGWVAAGLIGLLIVGAVWVAETLWQQRLRVVVKDSPEFNEACQRWTEALHRLQGDKLTPRGLKRFKNRVRFYAMMRPEKGEEGLLPGVSDASLVALGAIEQAGFLPPGQLDREDLDLAGLMNSPLDGSLKEEAVEAFGVLQRDAESGRTMRTAKETLRRA